MKTLEEMAIKQPTEQRIDEAAIYEDLISRLEYARDNNIPIDEGFFGSLFGGIAGATAGPAVMKGLCKVLGIDERGTFGSLLTSRMVLTALGGYLGWKS